MNTSSKKMSASVARGVAVGLCVLALSAQATEKKTSTVRVNKSTRLLPGGAGEYCTALVAGQVVRYRFEAGTPLDFTIGIQALDGVAIEPTVRQTAMQEVDYVDFRAQQAGRWCWRWVNRGGVSTELRYMLFVAPPKPARRR